MIIVILELVSFNLGSVATGLEWFDDSNRRVAAAAPVRGAD